MNKIREFLRSGLAQENLLETKDTVTASIPHTEAKWTGT